MTVVDTDLDMVEQEIAETLRLTHIVNPPMNEHVGGPGLTSKEIVFIAREFHIEVVALCGYRWVPVNDPEKYPVCEECMRIAGIYIKEDEG